MNDRSWRIVAVILAVILALLGGATIAFVIAPGSGPTPTPPTSLAIGSPSGSAGASASLPASGSPSPSALVASPSPTPTATPVPIAQFTLTEAKLEPRVPGSAGTARFVTFTSDGPGTIKVQLKAISPQGTTHICVRAGSKDLPCKDYASGTITATTTSAHVTWRVSLEGTGMFTPTVELTVTFPAVKPSVKITHARFDGTLHPDTNGIQVLFVPRAAGNARLVADWGHSFKYEIDATNQSSGAGDVHLANQGPATKVDKSIPVTAAETWKILLHNTADGSGTVDMTATISWP